MRIYSEFKAHSDILRLNRMRNRDQVKRNPTKICLEKIMFRYVFQDPGHSFEHLVDFVDIRKKYF